MNNYGLISNPFSTAALPQTVINPTLGLNQIENFDPVQDFTDSSNVKWQLVKAAGNATVEIPNPKNIQITDYWNHAFIGINSKIYVYVVEGIKQPRVETERPTRVLYQWFSTVFVKQFTPQMITDREWMKANVYAAPMQDSRLSKLYALCKVKTENGEVPTPVTNDSLIKVEEFNVDQNVGEYQGQSGQ